MASADEADWKPGSFTKNFSWGSEAGLGELHGSIRIGFANELRDVPRETFRLRVSDQNRPDYIPINFFLFNRQPHGVDTLIVDELVFQALTGPPGDRFDKLALFAFNFSFAGKFKRASPEQRHPALWANHYVRDRVAAEFKWDVRRVNAKDIERFVETSPKYKAQSARKLSTNLNHLYRIGKLGSLATERVERWWVDALFLALDRLIEDRRLDGQQVPESSYAGLLEASGFRDLSGKRSLEKNLAAKHLIKLYVECGGRDRFSEDAVRRRTEVRLKDVADYIAPNSPDPVGAVNPTNPRILKSIPSTCAMLARYAAGFDIVDAMSLEDFDAAAFIKQRTREAIERLQREGIEPTMTAEELLRLTRGK